MGAGFRALGLNHFIYNAHGDVVALTDENGSTVAEYAYDEFGNITSETGAVCNPPRYAAAYNSYYDSETGLYKMGVRYYNPQVGRWITRDDYQGEQEEPATQNRYAYVDGNPLRAVDLTGHWSSELHYKIAYSSALDVGFSSKNSKRMAAADEAFDGVMNAGVSPYSHFSRITYKEKTYRAWKSARPWRSRGRKDPRIRQAMRNLWDAAGIIQGKGSSERRWKRATTLVGAGLHRIEDTYAHLDVPWNHHFSKLDDPKWMKWRIRRANRAALNYLKYFSRAINS